MAYTWGSIKDSVLQHMDMTQQNAEDLNLIGFFPVAANEAMSHICSAIKPKYKYQTFYIYDDEADIPEEDERSDDIIYGVPGELYDMPDDFVSFGQDVNYFTLEVDDYKRNYEAFDVDWSSYGYSQIVFAHAGRFHISYNARWIEFAKTMDDNTVLEAPKDVLDAIPIYIISQCWKVLDDEVKAAATRNEYEISLARIDSANNRSTSSILIDGGW